MNNLGRFTPRNSVQAGIPQQVRFSSNDPLSRLENLQNAKERQQQTEATQREARARQQEKAAVKKQFIKQRTLLRTALSAPAICPAEGKPFTHKDILVAIQQYNAKAKGVGNTPIADYELSQFFTAAADKKQVPKVLAKLKELGLLAIERHSYPEPADDGYTDLSGYVPRHYDCYVLTMLGELAIQR